MLEVFDCDQNSEAWLMARLGLPTASEFSTILAKGRDGGDSKTRKTYMRKLAGEIITGKPSENYTNAHMERGHAMEDEARASYEFEAEVQCERVGFIRNGQKGCSPDSIIGSDGLLEIKTKLPHLFIEAVERGSFPPDHYAQCQGQIWVSEREWCDLVIYWPGMPKFIMRTHRDEKYIKTLSEAVDKFNDELGELVERIKRFGIPERAAA